MFTAAYSCEIQINRLMHCSIHGFREHNVRPTFCVRPQVDAIGRQISHIAARIGRQIHRIGVETNRPIFPCRRKDTQRADQMLTESNTASTLYSAAKREATHFKLQHADRAQNQPPPLCGLNTCTAPSSPTAALFAIASFSMGFLMRTPRNNSGAKK